MALAGLGVGLTQRERAALLVGLAAAVAFLGEVLLHAVVLARRTEAPIRRDVHDRLYGSLLLCE